MADSGGYGGQEDVLGPGYFKLGWNPSFLYSTKSIIEANPFWIYFSGQNMFKEFSF